MAKIQEKLIPSELTVGEEFTKTQLSDIFDSKDVLSIWGGIGVVKNCMLLLMTLDKSFLAELPNDVDAMEREELLVHSYKHLDYFDINEKIFGWDGPIDMNEESDLMKSFIESIYPCLLFARKYYYKNKEDREKNISNEKYVYCGKIKYVKHYESAPLHFISSVEDLQEQPNEKLKELYDFKPIGLDEKLKKFGLLEKNDRSEFMDLIKRDESRTHERKSTFSGGKTHMPEMTIKCLKAVAGFLNERGGNLMIGVQDNGDVTGIERDFSFKNQDHFEVYILTIMRNHIDNFETIQKYITIRFGFYGGEKIEKVHYINDQNEVAHKMRTIKGKGKLVCQINCRPLPNDIIAWVKGKLYSRVGPQTIELTAKEAVSWEKNRKK